MTKHKTNAKILSLVKSDISRNSSIDLGYQGYPESYRGTNQDRDEIPNHASLKLNHDLSELIHLGFVPRGSFYGPETSLQYIRLLDSVRSALEDTGGCFFRRYQERNHRDENYCHDLFILRNGLASIEQKVSCESQYSIHGLEIVFFNLDSGAQKLVKGIKALDSHFVIKNSKAGDKKRKELK